MEQRMSDKNLEINNAELFDPILRGAGCFFSVLGASAFFFPEVFIATKDVSPIVVSELRAALCSTGCSAGFAALALPRKHAWAVLTITTLASTSSRLAYTSGPVSGPKRARHWIEGAIAVIAAVCWSLETFGIKQLGKLGAKVGFVLFAAWCARQKKFRNPAAAVHAAFVLGVLFKRDPRTAGKVALLGPAAL